MQHSYNLLGQELVAMSADLEEHYEKWLYSVGWRVAVDAQPIIPPDVAR